MKKILFSLGCLVAFFHKMKWKINAMDIKVARLIHLGTINRVRLKINPFISKQLAMDLEFAIGNLKWLL